MLAIVDELSKGSIYQYFVSVVLTMTQYSVINWYNPRPTRVVANGVAIYSSY